MNFNLSPLSDDLPWHEKQWQVLRACVTKDRFPHALLLHGPMGVGKRIFAQRVAATLLCSQLTDSITPCGQCQSCHLLGTSVHPDFFLLEPEEGTSTIKIDQVRMLAERVTLTGQFGDRRMVVVDPVDGMTLGAANGFLKILEEPPAGVVFLLLSSRPGRLLATIKSRCVTLPFPIPPDNLAASWLASRVEGSPEVSLSLSLGAPLQALAIQSGQEDLIALRQKMIKELYSVVSGNGSPVNVSNLWSKMALMDVLAKIISWLADIIRVKMYLPDEKLINKDVVGELKSLSRFFDLPTLFRLTAIDHI
ncbi:MAG TPA: DNA polymerase III subunit delta', partial [Gammaproteobacteria bacterium]|nr:DNA polymerase III subunit delta' [Gammaproteobacteria bacterium]